MSENPQGVTGSGFNPDEVFDGARRHREYGEDPITAPIVPPPVAAVVDPEPTPAPADEDEPVRADRRHRAPEVLPEPAQPSTALELRPSLLPASVEEVQARKSTSGFWAMFRRRRFPNGDDMAALAEAEANIRQFTATRSNNVLVANPRSSGKTSTCLALGGTLAQVRGGSVVITEATPAPGDLFARAEGQPRLGLSELVERAEHVESIGALAGFTAPQTSRAAVIGSGTPRAELTPAQLLSVRRLLDTYYALTVTDSGNNPLSATFTAAVNTADAVVVPVLCSLASVRGAQRVREAIERSDQGAALLSRVVVVMTHDGGSEDPGLAAELGATLRGMFPDAPVLEVPYDPTIREDVVELSLGRLSERSRHAWTSVASHVVTALRSAPEPSPVPLAAGTTQEDHR